MTGYEQFIATGTPNTKAILWEIEISKRPENMLDFFRSFIQTQGFTYRIGKIIRTTTSIFEKDGETYRFAGAVNEGRRWAVKIERTNEN